MVVGKQATCSQSERASLASLTHDPISILFEMSRGLEAYHRAMRAATSRPPLGASQQLARQLPAQLIRQKEERRW